MKFNSLNLKPWIKEGLNNAKYFELTPIQEIVLTKTNIYQSLIITANTGTGKTLCYLLPVLNNINELDNYTQALIILPTKELANQVYAKIIELTKFNKNLKVKLLNTGDLKCANNIAHVVVGTPTKVEMFCNLNKQQLKVKYFVLDEADMLIDQGFYNVILNVFNRVRTPKLICYAASATLHLSLANQLKKILGNTKVISNASSIWVNEKLTHSIVYQSNMRESLDTLSRLLKTINPYFCIIFANTKKECEDIYQMMLKQNYNVVLIHKDLRPRQRKQIFEKINNNQYQYVIATDLLSRGVDLPNVDLVISYGLPQDTKWYIHRAGRVGRYTKNGISYLIYKPNDDQLINNLINKKINWNFLLINKENKLIEKPFKLRTKKKMKLDYSANAEIKKIINQGSKKVKPGYKKKIQAQINKIKQRKRHEAIEKKVKQQLLLRNINRSKKHKKHH